MAIRGVIFDISNTLLDPTGTPLAGIEDLIGFCKSRNLLIGAASNNRADVRSLANTQLAIDATYYPSAARGGFVKPSPGVLDVVCNDLGVTRSEIVYVGDSERTDAYLAANARVLFFRAAWKTDAGNYGIRADSPLFVQYFLDTFLLKDRLWHWTLNEVDGYGREVSIRAIMPGHPPDNVDTNIKHIGLRVFKDRNRIYFPYVPFFLNHILASLYVDGVAAQVDLWTPYPGSRPGSGNPVFLPQYTIASKLFHANYVSDLLIRHTRSIDSGQARVARRRLTFGNQVNTISLGQGYKDTLQGKKILVLDDFVTEGYSLECARNLLMEAGAQTIYCACIARYQRPYKIHSPRNEFRPSPFTPDAAAENLYECDHLTSGRYFDNSLELNESFNKFKQYKKLSG